MRSFFIAIAATLVFALTSVPALAQVKVDLAEYGRLPDVERTVLSPSGKRIAMLTTIDGKRVILTLEDQTKLISSTPVGDMKVRFIRWIGDHQLLVVSSQTEELGFNFTTDKSEFYVARVVAVSDGFESGLVFGNEAKILDSFSGFHGIRKVGDRHYGYFGGIELEKRTLSQSGYEFKHGRPFLYRVDLGDFSNRKVANAARAGFGNDWLVDANGEVAATMTVNATTGDWVLRGPSGGELTRGGNAAARVGLVGLGYDGTTAIYAERGEEATNWFEIPLAGGEPKEFLPDEDFDRLFFNDETGHLMGYLVGDDEPEPVFSDKKLEVAAKRALGAFGGLRARMIDWTNDLKQVVIRTSGNQDSGTIYAVDLANARANALAYERLKIGPKEVGPISTFAYTASDGMEMDGILTLPPGREPKDLPVVVMPHGGPHSHDTASFDWWAQAFASRGYAVFQPNFRGSTNRDAEFRSAGYGEWGRKMQTDKSDGLAALAEKGIVDPSRACIVGASYGGYAALAGVTLQQGIYRCAGAIAPVSDIRDYYREYYSATGRGRTTKVALLEQLGSRDGWDEVSPLRFAGRSDAPILLIHGKDDIIVDYKHSTRMADALKDADRPYEMVTLKGEDHWLSQSETRQQMLEATVRFVEKHNPPD